MDLTKFKMHCRYYLLYYLLKSIISNNNWWTPVRYWPDWHLRLVMVYFRHVSDAITTGYYPEDSTASDWQDICSIYLLIALQRYWIRYIWLCYYQLWQKLFTVEYASIPNQLPLFYTCNQCYPSHSGSLLYNISMQLGTIQYHEPPQIEFKEEQLKDRVKNQKEFEFVVHATL